MAKIEDRPDDVTVPPRPEPDLTGPLGDLQDWEQGVVARDRPRLRRPQRPNIGRLVPPAVILLGSYLLFMALLLPLVVAPRIGLVPLAPFTVLVAEGKGSYFSVSQGRVVDTEVLVSTTTIRGDAAAGNEEVAVWDTFTAVEDLRIGVPAAERVIEATDERVALDRRTGQPVPCCEEQPAHEGLTWRFPFDTAPQSYDLWDPVIRESRPAEFQRPETIGGLSTFVFRSVVEPVTVGSEVVPGSLVNSPEPSVEVTVSYDADTTIWVEPRTGRIVREQRICDMFLESAEGLRVPFARRDTVWTPDTVNQQLAEAQRDVARLDGSSSALPLAALVGGVALLGLGVILTALARAGRPARRD